jgi:hypothetical protein
MRLALAAVVLALTARSADAYEFWLHSRTLGQAYQLRGYKLVGPDLLLGRRRYTQTLALRITDIGELSRDRREARLPDRGLTIAWYSYLRVDHDFGSYSNAQLGDREALDVIPELGDSLIDLDLLYGYLELDGIADDSVTLRVGRTLVDDGWGTRGLDGATARVELPPPVAITAAAGFAVREASPLGTAAFELDGTTGAGCVEYVESANAWRLIDRQRPITETPFRSDFEYCPERTQWQPTIAVGLATSRLRRFGAELGYRRTWSRTFGLIDAPDRLGDGVDDRGLYPDGAPGRGINAEQLHARAHAALAAGPLAIEPGAAARFSLVHGAIDRAELGVRIARGAHALEPGVAYFLPTFDADSIFNVFAIEPTVDARLGYRYAGGRWRATADAWARRFLDGAAAPLAGGLAGGIERAFDPRLSVRADALWDAGYGGRRIGGGAEASWRAQRSLWLRGRIAALAVAPDDGHRRYVATSAVTSSSWRRGDAAAIHAVLEVERDGIQGFDARALGVLDLAFAPEP